MSAESPVLAIAAEPAPESRAAAFWRAFSANRGALAGLVLALLLVACALFAPWLAPHSPLEQYRDAVLKPPVWLEGGDARFLLGTDPVGRDLLSRLIFGARLSLGLGLVSVTLSLALGVLLGLLAGYARGWVDALVMRIADVLIALPALLLAIAVVAVIGPSLGNTMIAVAIVMLPHYVRLTRATVLQEREREYVLASRIAGAGPLRLMFSVILPNCAAPLIVQATLGFSTAILDAAALGFLGLGAQPPAAEWGAMLAGALEFIESAWWVTSLPGLAIFLTVLAFNLLGDGLRDALDPRLRQ
ncbi:ABC transporter permease subunit [Niveibacterium sp. SC-1]|uniref:ABC transporter permease subunit n=1 Tax=Niveibacterium sp. SC-1 TaxID=3135646 RepID=UPI00311E7044